MLILQMNVSQWSYMHLAYHRNTRTNSRPPSIFIISRSLSFNFNFIMIERWISPELKLQNKKKQFKRNSSENVVLFASLGERVVERRELWTWQQWKMCRLWDASALTIWRSHLAGTRYSCRSTLGPRYRSIASSWLLKVLR